MEVLSGGASNARIWIENHPSEGWAPGRVDSVGANGNYIVVDDKGDKFEVRQEDARPVDPNCIRGVDDLISLGDFNEGALLHNVRCRYFDDSIYTGIGSPILISVNPFQNLPGLYSVAKQKFYREQSAAAGNGEEANLPPHLFSVAAASYTAMLHDSKNQSVIISGESGAGKTEATKKILMYFANLQQTSGTETEKMSVEEQVLRSNPILEAFGNAKTIRNDNSSRFGKFIDIEFDPSGKLTSARISNYLLEKSRIVKQQPDERGYHVFYQICAGAAMSPDMPSLGLRAAHQHAYTSVCTEIDGVDDASMLEEAVECMDGLGFSMEEKRSVFQLVAAVLHLGDMQFEEGSDGSLISDAAMADKICELLHVSKEDFTRTFQFKTLEDPFSRQIINMPQDPANSSNTRHSMAKHLYSRLFDWLVWRINQSTAGKGTGKKESMKKIGILDIYGFEVFEWNSFEQLCINFANEKLQQHFNSHMFTMEQRLYTEEGISWSHIEWQDNREIIDGLEKKPFGLFCILDSECLMPNATDDTCLSKIHSTFKSSKVVYKTSRFKSTNFAVAHYAGEVVYDVLSFIEKNTDKLHADIINLLKSSSMPVLNTLFSDPRFAPDTQAQAPRSGASPPPRRGETNQRAKQNITVSMMFRQQLDQLVEDLNRTNPRYIRCIKPNSNKQAREMDSLDVQRQLRCAGMLESIRIRRAGYPVRRPFKEFFNRFRILCPHVSSRSADPDYKELSRRVMTDIEAKWQAAQPLEPRSWQIGRSKVFLKEEVQSRLDKAIAEAVKVFVLRISKRWRGFRERRRYRAMQQAAMQVQAALRSLRPVHEYRAKQLATLQVQAGLRSLRSVLVFQNSLRAAQAKREQEAAEQARHEAEEKARSEAQEKARGQAEDMARREAEEKARLEAEDRARREAEEKVRREAEEKVRLEAEEKARREAEEKAELEQRQRHLSTLQQEQRGEIGSERAHSLDQLRNELLARIETRSVAAASNRPSIMLNEDGRKTLLNQREVFEVLKQRFHEAQEATDAEPELVISNSDRELELEEELRKFRKEHVELKIKLTSVEDEFEQKCQEAKQLLSSCSELQAEVEDLKVQLAQESATAKKQASKMSELQALLANAETDLPALRKRINAAEEQAVQAQEEARAAQQRCGRTEEEKELVQQRLKQTEASASTFAQRERDLQDQLKELKDQLEATRHAAEVAESRKAQSESSHHWWQAECERVKGQLSEANSDLAKMRQIADEVLKVKESQADSEVEKWKKQVHSLEKELSQAKQLGQEMTEAMRVMTQAVSERGDSSGQAKVLVLQIEKQKQELKSAKRERDEAQRALDEIQSSGDYFKERFRSAQDDIRNLKQENSHLSATNEKLKKRIDSTNQDAEVKSIDGLTMGPESFAADSAEELRERLKSQSLELTRREMELKHKAEELNRSKAFAERTQLVNDCLNELLVLESEQSSLYENLCDNKGIKDLDGQLAEKKAKASLILSRLNQYVKAEQA